MPFNLSAEAVRKIFIFGVVLFFAVPFGGYYGFIYWGNGLAGAMLGLLLGVSLTVIVLIITSRSVRLFGALAGERKANFSKREQLESDMQQVRFHKMRKEYDMALQKVGKILELDPEFPEALFLKAQIMWEGFGDGASAVSDLEKIQMIVKDRQSAVYRWALSLLAEIKKK